MDEYSNFFVDTSDTLSDDEDSTIETEEDDNEITEESLDNEEEENNCLSVENNKIYKNFQYVELPSLPRMTEYEITYILQIRVNMLQNRFIYDTVKVDPYLVCLQNKNDIEYNIARIELYLKIIPFFLIRKIYNEYHVKCKIEALDIDHEFYLSENEILSIKNI